MGNLEKQFMLDENGENGGSGAGTSRQEQEVYYAFVEYINAYKVTWSLKSKLLKDGNLS